ncbi:RipA family octameric membrane protein [Pantoea agglomerans]|uniref:RipA family octameric membrane protein n=1 Tax=Enterobacter agglomerans TaxID=549 RepID=UPI00165429FF|nr:hypothetical protein [Pantoea agglomerans]
MTNPTPTATSTPPPNTDLITEVTLPTETRRNLTDNSKYFYKLLGKNFSNTATIVTKHDLNRIEKAYDASHRIRDFEINLYWQRLNYLWVITAVLLAAWGVLASKVLETEVSATKFTFASMCLMSIAGCIFSLLSSYITEAGKHWQLVWEHHICRLEPFISGSIYNIKFKNTNGEIPSISRTVELIILFLFVLWSLSLWFSACLTFGTVQNPSVFTGLIATAFVVGIFLFIRFKVMGVSKKQDIEIIT